MEKLIEDILERLKESNLHSAVARQNIVRSIMKEIRKKNRGFFLNMSTIDDDIPEVGDRLEEERWVCAICGKSTYEVEYDYMGSGTNHLGCELKVSEKNNNYVYSGDLQKQAYIEMTSDGLPEGGDSQAVLESHKLAEEISSGTKDLGYIFESPDGGKTIYKRQVGESERELVTKYQWKDYNRNR